MFSPAFIVLEGTELRAIPAADNAARDAPFLINSLRGLLRGVMILGIEVANLKIVFIWVYTNDMSSNNVVEIAYQAMNCKGSEYHKIVSKLIA